MNLESLDKARQVNGGSRKRQKVRVRRRDRLWTRTSTMKGPRDLKPVRKLAKGVAECSSVVSQLHCYPQRVFGPDPESTGCCVRQMRRRSLHGCTARHVRQRICSFQAVCTKDCESSSRIVVRIGWTKLLSRRVDAGEHPSTTHAHICRDTRSSTPTCTLVISTRLGRRPRRLIVPSCFPFFVREIP
jgi:hypothetical protein